ncbi:MAG TPA: type II toxin-antitoxin system VapC family toxin [Polyangia bacterium]
MPKTRLLLDTHALLWWAVGDRALPRKVRHLIEDEETTVVVSAASAWEIATKVRLGRLSWKNSLSLEAYCADQRFEVLPITFAHAERAGAWPQDHGDPFDRMLAAQSEIERIPLVTNDGKIALFGIETVW